MPPFDANWALFLDVDGTLLELADSPGAVRVGDAHRDLLASLARVTRGALALISGRSIGDLDALFAPLRLPAAGQHGIEVRLADGSLARRAAPADASLRDAAARLRQLQESHPGVFLEDKGVTLALHYRHAPALEPALRDALQAVLRGLGARWELQEGKFVFEIKPAGMDKGTAIAEFMRHAPFAGRTPVFLGDDLTDERGFEYMARCDGHAIKVGPGTSRARWRLDDPAAARAWLGRYAAQFRDPGGAAR